MNHSDVELNAVLYSIEYYALIQRTRNKKSVHVKQRFVRAGARVCIVSWVSVYLISNLHVNIIFIRSLFFVLCSLFFLKPTCKLCTRTAFQPPPSNNLFSPSYRWRCGAVWLKVWEGRRVGIVLQCRGKL